MYGHARRASLTPRCPIAPACRGTHVPVMTFVRAAWLGLPLLIAACATGPTLAQRLSVFIGLPEVDLVAGLGVPLRSFDGDGRRFLEFEQRRLLSVPEPYVGGFGRRGGFYGGTTYTNVTCSITFALRDGRAESFTFRGDGCW